MKPPLTRRSFQSHARVGKESSSGGAASFMYRHPLLCLCLVLFIEDVLWLSWLYTSNSDCDCPGMAGFKQERQLQRSLHMKERDDTSKVLHATPKAKKKDQTLPEQRRKMPVYKPNKEAYQDLLQQVEDPSLLERLPDLPFNAARSALFRKEIWEKTRVQDYLYASKKSMPLGSVIPFFEGRNKSTYYMVPDVYNYLPEEVHWPKSMYENCSVIGNGGILLNSSCGPEIDSTQYVFRNNLPPLTLEFFGRGEDMDGTMAKVDYYKDVGRKANFISVNPSGFNEFMYDFKKERIITDFVEYLSQYEDKGAKVWSHMFHYDSKAKLVLRAIVIIRAMGAKTEMVSSHPVFLQAVNDFWKMNGLTSTRISSGLVFTTIALAMCKETHLYGYWPFPVDYEGQEVPYHYYLYDYQHTQNNTFHKLPEEFKMLQTLHKKGVIKLHIGKCKQ
ncbi:CMP-N-acetylneuraminate-poly-alpha-2,8-sialyltransferase-like [Branchiostoma floridae]|uniref:CMP-N-acetylneuraminate-poly-alpha-2, 8-sialyltransferase-like n=1 Tax=Branchiostoma floridae TaxID=7739 RepID=A0A9J7N6M2_BRAFL|nr:CMP-N-acetylneuraminate-poly-alpha-2,8-sialyltransferase-like [Branchiostoma floridae]